MELKMRDESSDASAQIAPALERLRAFFHHSKGYSEMRGVQVKVDTNSIVADGGQRTRVKALGAVLVPVFQCEGAVRVLYTRRAHNLLSHRGEIAFPGGKFDPVDRDLMATALRETCEEVGLTDDQIEVLGRLPFAETSRSGVAVTPFVGIVHSLDSLRPNPNEVAEIFSVPLNALLDPRQRVPYRYLRSDGSSTTYPGIKYHGHVIWGLTLRITMALLDCFERADKLYSANGEPPT
jgi:8-oxo-dGTP pyrophosphatase MutT (NUDIX family)